MRGFHVVKVIAYAFLVVIIGVFPAMAEVEISEAVRLQAAQVPADSCIDMLLSFDNDLDHTALKMSRMIHKPTRMSAYREVMDQLCLNRNNLERDLTPFLERMKSLRYLQTYRFFTASKTVQVRVKASCVDSLSQLPELRLINLNSPVNLIEPVAEEAASFSAAGQLAQVGLNAVQIHSLWNRGLTGTGRLICSFDTGVDGDHPALSSKWRGNNGGSVSASWFAPHGDTIPEDNLGHGSHVMGVLGGSLDGDTIGVAPGAEWISAAVIDQGVSLNTTVADILAAFDWALNPDGDINTIDDVPDVICNSWGVPKGVFSDCDSTFWTAIDNVEAAGIVTVFAAGNEGPDSCTIRNPADRASSPTNALSVGAIDPTSLIVASFSSRGPAGCNSNAIKPELVAPGVGIYSTYKDGGYRIMSGTSMATPFVAGLVALMRQYNPDATVEQIKSALIAATIDLGPSGEDNSYGYGLIDASRLLDYMPTLTVSPVQILSSEIIAGGDVFADPGESVELYFTFCDTSGTADSIDVWIASEDSILTITQDTIRYEFEDGSQYAGSSNPFRLRLSPEAVCGEIAHILTYARHCTNGIVDTLPYDLSIGHISLPADDNDPVLPKTIELFQNCPNPFNPETVIRFTSKSDRQACLEVFNLTGQKIRTLFDGMAKAGENRVVWDGRDKSGESVPSGIYFYRLRIEDQIISKKMILLK